MNKEKHEHIFELTSAVVPLYKYISEDGKRVKQYISGRDTLKQFKFKCGKTNTVDLERVKA